MRRTGSLTLLLLAAAPLFGGSIVKVGDLVTPRARHTATTLPDGRIVVAGGNSAVTTMELTSVQQGRATSAVSQATTALPLIGHTATRLPSGEVVIAGGGYRTDGRPSFGRFGDTRVSTYRVDTARDAAPMHEQRQQHEATLLPDGRVLVTGGEWVDVGGFHIWRVRHSSAEILSGGSTRMTAPMREVRSGHTATLLADGRVLLTGGTADGGPLASAEVFDPATESFQFVSSMRWPRHSHTATLLRDGRVLIVGGSDEYAATAEIFDPAESRFVAVASDLGHRRHHTATLLPDGTVFIAGGADDAVVYDPRTDAIVDRVSLGGPTLAYHSDVLLGDGSVLLIGGARGDLGSPVTDILRYSRDGHSRRRAVRK